MNIEYRQQVVATCNQKHIINEGQFWSSQRLQWLQSKNKMVGCVLLCLLMKPVADTLPLQRSVQSNRFGSVVFIRCMRVFSPKCNRYQKRCVWKQQNKGVQFFPVESCCKWGERESGEGGGGGAILPTSVRSLCIVTAAQHCSVFYCVYTGVATVFFHSFFFSAGTSNHS